MSRFFAVLFAALLLTLPAAAAAEPAEDDTRSSDETLIASAEETPAAEVKEMPPVVVTATRMETPVREVASSITVISEEEIEQKQKTTVLDALRGIPGLDISRKGGPGAQASAFIRGAKSEHTLVLIDGIEVNDPISPGRAFDFAHLSVDNVERIEILRGPQSTLYGSDAIGGVINIITKKGSGEPKFYVSGEYGSFYSFREAAGVSGGTELFNYSLSVSHTETDGISAANEEDGNEEEDGYKNTSIATRFGLTPTENFEVDLVLRYLDAEADLDNFGGAFGDDPNSTQDKEEFLLRAQARLSLCDDSWEQTLGVSFTNQERKSRNDIDATHPLDWSRQLYESELLTFDWQHNFYLHETNTLTLGLETEEEKLKFNTYFEFENWFPPPAVLVSEASLGEKSVRNNAIYVQDQIKLNDSLFTTVGLRLDDHEDFGSEVTFRITGAYLFEETGTKLKATYGTGFKAPTLYQLYGPADPVYGPVGNLDLDPEKSRGWDAGIEQKIFGDRVIVGATYFVNDFEDLIEFPWGTGYMNVSKAEADGIELSASIRPCEDLLLRGNYTYTHTENKNTGEELLQRPKDKFGVDVNYRFGQKGSADLEVLYVGKRLDYGQVRLGGYAVVNLAASYDINENLKVFGRIENLLDRKYEEAKGFGTPGHSVFAGMKVLF